MNSGKSTNYTYLFILNNLKGGGAERVFVNIANSFVKNGLQVDILLGEKTGIYFNILDSNIAVYELKAATFRDYILKLPAFLKTKRYQYIFTASDYISAAAIITNKVCNKKNKIIATLHYDLQYQLSILPTLNKLWLGWLNKKIITKAYKIVAVSTGVATGFEKNANKKINNISVIHNPVYDDTIISSSVAHTDFNFDDKQVLINMGRLDVWKHQKTIIEAMELLKQLTDLHLIILGDGNQKDNLKHLANKFGLSNKVHFLGFTTNPFKYLKHAKLFVLSSLHEGFGNVIVEAMALGINVVSTNCPSGPAEILNNGEYGWLCNVNDAADMALKIKEALQYPKSKQVLQQRASLYHVDVATKKYFKLINE